MIYNDFFGFSEEPFGVTPDPKFLFHSKEHDEAIAHIQYGIEHGRGFIMFTGEIGSGKTTIIRHIMDQLGEDTQTAIILNPRMNAAELLKSINHDFGLKIKRTATLKTLMEELNTFLIENHRRGHKVMLAIDEAQEMSPECLEFVRLLSNLETDTRKLLQVVLIGQPELRDIVRQKRLTQLNQRIAVRFHLRPLTRSETQFYLNHRLRVAGSIALSFPPQAAAMVHRFSKGVPRLTNLAADRTLMTCYAEGAAAIRPSYVRRAIQDLKDEAAPGRKTTLRPAFVWVLVAALIMYSLIGALGGRQEVIRKFIDSARSAVASVVPGTSIGVTPPARM